MKKVISKIGKITVGAILAVMITTSLTMAQDAAQSLKNKTPVQRAQFQTGMMKSKLKLDTMQITRVQAINLKYAEKFEPILKGDGSKFSRLRQAKSLQSAKDAELKGVFTADQYKQYQKAEEDLKDRMKQFAGN